MSDFSNPNIEMLALIKAVSVISSVLTEEQKKMMEDLIKTPTDEVILNAVNQANAGEREAQNIKLIYEKTAKILNGEFI